MNENLYNYYMKAKAHVIEAGYAGEIKWCEDRKFDDVDAVEFLSQYVFAVFCSSGLNNKVVRTMEQRFWDARNTKGENSFSTIKNRRMRFAISEMFTDHKYKEVFEKLQKIHSDEDKIEFLQTLRQIGTKEKMHLARNLGLDCIKPDIHIIRLADNWGYLVPKYLALEIQEHTLERVGVIDVVLWRYCNLTGDYGEGMLPK